MMEVNGIGQPLEISISGDNVTVTEGATMTMTMPDGVTMAEGEVVILPSEMHHHHHVSSEIQQIIGEEAFDRFQELCADLNLDGITKENVLQTFTTVKQKFTLEGDPAHWLCCGIYVACRQACVPSVGSPSTFHGNYVNLTRLLRTSRLSLVDFFDKSRKWADMTDLNQEFRSKIERLERNFAVTTVIFKKFEPIFSGIFKDFSRMELDEYRANRKKLSPRSAADLFEFCWTLFLCVKSSLRISDDLVNSYHLLLASTDLVFFNVAHANRKNLLTPKFQEYADMAGLVDLRLIGSDPACIINVLCDLYDGISVEAKTIKEYWLKPKIRSMMEQGLLRGDADTLTGLIDEDAFESNSKRLEKEYEEYVLTEGDFDERMYLSAERQADFGMDTQDDFMKPFDKQTLFKTCPPLNELQLRHMMPATPLTGKKYLGDKDDPFISPVSSATQTVSRLQALLSGRKAEASQTLRDMIAHFPKDPLPGMDEKVKNLSELFCVRFACTKGEKQPGMHTEFAYYRSQLAQTLYYRLLESILSAENKQRADKSELASVMMDESFQTSLFACALEIVLFSYSSPKRFPWILDVFDLPGYSFFKVIEIVVRAEENLSRDVVKHLSQVEETVLEELAWAEDSPLWAALSQRNEPTPGCEEVFLPSQMEKTGDGQNQENPPKRYAVIKTPQGEKCVPVAVGGSNQSTLIIQDKNSSQILGVVLPSKHGDKPKRGSSTALFFRKFYHLAFVRLQDLCKNLNIEEDVLRKIWTCFQQSIVNFVVDLMKGRHLDQIIMCCVYVVSKVIGKSHEKTFTEIMRCYRLQPQSASRVYRLVYLGNGQKGDLIRFYNTVFITCTKDYVAKFSPSRTEEGEVPLSPIPHLKATPMSPCRRVASKHSVFLRPLKGAKSPSPTKQLRYNFARSPSTNLRAINTMVQSAEKPKIAKRILVGEGAETAMESVVPNKFVKRLQEFIDDRQTME